MLSQILGFLASLELEEEYGFLQAAEELAVLVAAHAQNSPGSSGVFSLLSPGWILKNFSVTTFS